VKHLNTHKQINVVHSRQALVIEVELPRKWVYYASRQRALIAPVRCGRGPGGRTGALVAILALAKLGLYPFSLFSLQPSWSLSQFSYSWPRYYATLCKVLDTTSECQLIFVLHVLPCP
jgi:hypothetical protein